MTEEEREDGNATLDPPGSIAVVGAGPLGVEAALYGRYLGYDVTLLEAVEVASSIVDRRDQAIPMMPGRCVSPLARSALGAQAGLSLPEASPMLIGQWIDQVWRPLTETDLLRGRLRCPVAVTEMDLVPTEDEDESLVDRGPQGEEISEDVPPDFRLRFDDGQTADFEAVILATGGRSRAIKKLFAPPVDYLFELGEHRTENAEVDFWVGLKEIVAVYASLGGRADLDLYKPLRG
jgi:hypothetical protein